MRIAMVLIGSALVVAWFVSMASIGMAKQDEWYGHMDKPVDQSADITWEKYQT